MASVSVERHLGRVFASQFAVLQPASLITATYNRAWLLRAPLPRLWRWLAHGVTLRVKCLSVREGRRFLRCFFRALFFDSGLDLVHVKCACALLGTLGLLVGLSTANQELLSVFCWLLRLEMLLRESRRQDEALPRLGLSKCLRSYWESFQVRFVLLLLGNLFLELPRRRNTRRHWLSRELHWYLLRTP